MTAPHIYLCLSVYQSTGLSCIHCCGSQAVIPVPNGIAVPKSGVQLDTILIHLLACGFNPPTLETAVCFWAAGMQEPGSTVPWLLITYALSHGTAWCGMLPWIPVFCSALCIVA